MNPRPLGLVQVGIIYKAIYIAVAAYYLAIGQMPHAIFAWFAAFDIVFLLQFVRFLGGFDSLEAAVDAVENRSEPVLGSATAASEP